MESAKDRKGLRTSLKRNLHSVIQPLKDSSFLSDENQENNENVKPPSKKMREEITRKQAKAVLGISMSGNETFLNATMPEPKKRKRATNELRRQLHLGQSTNLCCREREAAAVREFCLKAITEKRNASLYVSGPPGTGKTAVVTSETERMAKEGKCTTIQINCMRISSPSQLYTMLYTELKKTGVSTETRAQRELEEVLNKRSVKFPLVFVLDEMDQLGVHYKEALYRVFDWVGLLSCRLMVIGIANALDLTDRLLPRLQLREYKPKLLHFPPYTPAQISQIVTGRFTTGNSENNSPNSSTGKMDAIALQLCAKKVAASSGDVRSALDICRRSLELAERDARRNHLPLPSSPSLLHISRAIEAARGSVTKGSGDSDLPLQQQLTLAAAMLLRRGPSGKKEWSLGALHDRYTALCANRQIGPLDTGEFSGVCQLLEARGLMQVRPGKEARLTKLALRLDDRGLEGKLSDQPLLSCVLAK